MVEDVFQWLLQDDGLEAIDFEPTSPVFSGFAPNNNNQMGIDGHTLLLEQPSNAIQQQQQQYNAASANHYSGNAADAETGGFGGYPTIPTPPGSFLDDMDVVEKPYHAQHPLQRHQSFTWARNVIDNRRPAYDIGEEEQFPFIDASPPPPLVKPENNDDLLFNDFDTTPDDLGLEEDEAEYKLNEMPVVAQVSNVKQKAPPTKPKPKKVKKAPMNPKALKEREKNREAVRNCRKRKIERRIKLQERESELRRENERFTLQLRLGSHEKEMEIHAAAEVMVKKMAGLLQQPNKTEETEVELRELVDQYIKFYSDINANRGDAFRGIVSRLDRLNKPTAASKMYLWQNAQSDEYFTVEDGLWSRMIETLGLSHDQEEKLKKRRKGVASVCKEIASTLENIHKVKLIVEQQRKPIDGIALNAFHSVFTPVQFARLLVFVYTDERVKRFDLDSAWNKSLKGFDEAIKAELAKGNYRFTVPAGSPKTIEEKEAFLMNKRHGQCLILKGLFESERDKLEELALNLFSADVEMFDPNFKHPVRGIDKIIKHACGIRNAFEDLKAKEEDFDMKRNKNVARSRWELRGTYVGKVNKDKTQQRPGKTVSFIITFALKFIPGEYKVKQLVVSWAAIDLMQQLGIVPNEALAFRNRRTSNLSIRQLHDICISFCKVFETNESSERESLSKKFLDEACTFTDSNMGGTNRGHKNFVDYVERFRMIFSDIKISRHNFVGGSEGGSPLRFHMGCLIAGVYRGRLTRGDTKPFEFTAEIYFVFNPDTDRIKELVMTWQAGQLMEQIGVIRS